MSLNVCRAKKGTSQSGRENARQRACSRTLRRLSQLPSILFR